MRLTNYHFVLSNKSFQMSSLVFFCCFAWVASGVPAQCHAQDGWLTQQLSNEFFGEGATVGDFNRDGYVDIVVGAKYHDGAVVDNGSVTVYSGMDGTEMYRLSGVNQGDYFGSSVAVIGDIDLDGVDDHCAHRSVAVAVLTRTCTGGCAVPRGRRVGRTLALFRRGRACRGPLLRQTLGFHRKTNRVRTAK